MSRSNRTPANLDCSRRVNTGVRRLATLRAALPILLALGSPVAQAAPGEPVLIENDICRLKIDPVSGAISSFFVKAMNCELIGEPRLADNFRINLPLPDDQSHYIDGMTQSPNSISRQGNTVTVRFGGMKTPSGSFPLDLVYTIALDGDQVVFRAKLTNNHRQPVAEFWFPRLGGWTRFGEDRAAALAQPGYGSCGHWSPIFKSFPGGQGLGAEAAEFSSDYPGMVMPWWSIHDPKSGKALYLGYHDKTARLSTWHMYLMPTTTGSPADSFLTPEQAGGRPVGLVFSHVRYPFIHSGETFDTGEFIFRVHDGDWHPAAKFYRNWFMKHFPFDKSKNWLRRQSAWFTSIIYQPEDKVIADFKTYDRWCEEAKRFGVNTYELIGWHKGGLERGYPEYVAEKRLGGHEGFRNLIASVHQRNGRILPFVNYNILDSATDLYRTQLKPYTHQDQYGSSPNWMAWGESTLIARKGLSVRRHLLASIVPPIEKMLEDHFVQIAKDGADGLQIDKVVVSTTLDFNPLNTRKPDEALNQGLVEGIERIYRKCREVNPDFCLASEALQDRLIPYVDVYYRAAGGYNISPLRYAFPEWTACQHVAAPRDFNGVNSGVLVGAVLCIEPLSYQGSMADPLYEDLSKYIRETERIRNELLDTVFCGDYFDMLDASVIEMSMTPNASAPAAASPPADDRIIPAGTATLQGIYSGQMHWRVHGHLQDGRRAIVVINTSPDQRYYTWQFKHRDVQNALLYEPFRPVQEIRQADAVRIQGERFQVVIEKQ